MQLRGRQTSKRTCQSFNCFFPQAAPGRTTESFQASEWQLHLAGVVDALDPNVEGHLGSNDTVCCLHTFKLSLTHTDRATTGTFFSYYMHIYAPDGSKKPPNYSDAPANRGEQLACAACTSSDGTLSVSLSGRFLTHADSCCSATNPTDFMDDDEEGMDNQVWPGNRHRKVWKSTSTRVVLNVRVPNSHFSSF
jgi:hypothetical protein